MGVKRLNDFMTTEKQRGFETDFTLDTETNEVWYEIEVGPVATARSHDPVIAHPLFAVQIAFYGIERGPGDWLRSPGARKPGNRPSPSGCPTRRRPECRGRLAMDLANSTTSGTIEDPAGDFAWVGELGVIMANPLGPMKGCSRSCRLGHETRR